MRRRIGAILAGLGALLLAGAVAAAGTVSAVPDAVTVPPREVGVPPGARTLVCPGPVQLSQTAAPAAGGAYDPTPVPTVTTGRVVTLDTGAGAGPVELDPLGGGDPVAHLDGPAAGSAGLGTVDGPLRLAAGPVAGNGPVAATAVLSRTTAGDLRGLAGASCQTPGSDLWLVAGSTELSSSARLTLQNPGQAPASVTLEVYGVGGPVDLGSSREVIVPPRAERTLLVEGIATTQRRVAVHVTSTGALVTATLQDSRLDGFTPAGTDLAVPGATPAPRQVVPGIVLQGGDPFTAAPPVLRLLAPAAGGTARITLEGPDGPVDLGDAASVPLAAGAVTDVSLAAVPAGAYTAVVEADVPVVASAMVVRTAADGSGPLERAWVASTTPVEASLVALPDAGAGSAATVVLGAAGGSGGGAPASVTLRAVDADGGVLGEQTLTLADGHASAVPVAELAGGRPAVAVVATSVAPEGGAGAGALPAWSVLLTAPAQAGGELVASLAPVAAAVAGSTVPVRLDAQVGLG